MTETEELQEYMKRLDPGIEVAACTLDDLVFDERVRLKCYCCENYDRCLRCPGNFPAGLDMEKAIRSSDHMALIFKEFDYRPDMTQEELRESGRQMHRHLIQAERFMMGRDHMLSSVFIAGRCRQCGECPADGRCRKPEIARPSMEAAGLDVISSAKNAGIDVTFTDSSRFKRIGLLCW